MNVYARERRLFWQIFMLAGIISSPNITVKKILDFTPDNPLAAAGVLLLLYALKSLTLVFPLAVLEIASGHLFPVWAALPINFMGILIDLTIPYWFRYFSGMEAIQKLMVKYPKFEAILDRQKNNSFFLCFFLCIIGGLPADVVTAERYIFLEFFIVQDGIMWGRILNVLEQKAAHGVKVRLLYDDIGCFLLLSSNYAKQLEKFGIECSVFNPFRPVLTVAQNNRDHRKIISVDGKVAFTGGINLADEYINAIEKHGHWKDYAIMLHGKAAWSLTLTAKRGADVRIVTPHIWDKRIAHMTTRSYYRDLIQAGVKIYEYRNGFMHSKTFVSDDRIATIGTTNLDFRSLYLHKGNLGVRRAVKTKKPC